MMGAKTKEEEEEGEGARSTNSHCEAPGLSLGRGTLPRMGRRKGLLGEWRKKAEIRVLLQIC